MTNRSKATLELWGGILVAVLFALLLSTALVEPANFSLGEKVLFFGLLLAGINMSVRARKKRKDPMLS